MRFNPYRINYRQARVLAFARDCPAQHTVAFHLPMRRPLRALRQVLERGLVESDYPVVLTDEGRQALALYEAINGTIDTRRVVRIVIAEAKRGWRRMALEDCVEHTQRLRAARAEVAAAVARMEEAYARGAISLDELRRARGLGPTGDDQTDAWFLAWAAAGTT